MSALNDILDAALADATAAALTIGPNTPTVVKRKLPKKEETVDAAYQVTISGAERVDKVDRLAFGNVFKVEYAVELTLITPSEDAATHLPEHAAWRETMRARYMGPTRTGPLRTVTAVKGVEVDPAPFLDRRKLAVGFNYDQLALRVTTYEVRT